jgi:hypothetical protein
MSKPKPSPPPVTEILYLLRGEGRSAGIDRVWDAFAVLREATPKKGVAVELRGRGGAGGNHLIYGKYSAGDQQPFYYTPKRPKGRGGAYAT